MPDDQNPDEQNRTRRLPQSPGSRPDHQLPWPGETDPARLGDQFQHGGSAEQRDLGNEFTRSSEADSRELGREFSDPHYADDRRLAKSFADPNSLDDAKVGKSFEQATSSRPKPPLKDRVHMPHPSRDPRQRRIVWIVLASIVALFLIVLFVGWLPRHSRDKETKERAQKEKDEKPTVQIIKVRRTPSTAGLVVPGTTLPLTEAYVYARANGYLKTRLADIGDHVRKGQLLAVIDAPDLDQQVDQARQQLRQAEQQREQQKAQLALAAVTVNRYRVLVAKGVFSRQEGDQRETDYSSQQSLVAAADRNVEAFRANLRRVEALQSYEYVRAPFDGVITQRNVDVGALISASGTSSGSQSSPAPMGQFSSTGGSQQGGQTNNAGTSGATSQAGTPSQTAGQGGPLFGIGQLRRLRILVSVPEGYVSAIHPGATAHLAFQEYAGVPVNGTVTRTSNAVDPNTRTMLTEVQVDNADGRLVPGMYAVATFPPSPGAVSPITIPGDAIVIRHDTSSVAKVENGKVRFAPVVLGRDFGDVVEVVSGVREGDIIITEISDDVTDGREVKPEKDTTSEQHNEAPQQDAPPGGSTQYGNQGITDRNLQGQQQKQNQKGSGTKGGDQNKANQKENNSRSKP